MLAVLSSIDAANGSNLRGAINAITAAVTGSGGSAPLSDTVIDALLSGIVAAGAKMGGSDPTSLLAVMLDGMAKGSAAVSIDDVATDNIINAGEQDVAISGNAITGSVVTLSIGGVTRTPTLTGTTWSFTLTPADEPAMGQGFDVITATAALKNHVSVAHRGVFVDTAAPTASVTTATFAGSGNAVVQSSETGTAYLVDATLAVTNVASITSAPDNHWNAVAVGTANTNTNLSTTGLADGRYQVYTADIHGRQRHAVHAGGRPGRLHLPQRDVDRARTTLDR